MDQRVSYRIGDKSASYQAVKYILLMLNLMIVTTIANIAVVIVLIRNSKVEIEVVNLVRCLTIYEIDIIRMFRYVVLSVSAIIIILIIIAVYGLYKEKSGPILFSSSVIGLITQLTVFVLPANTFLLLMLYIVFSICYVILLNRIIESSKQTALLGRGTSYVPSMDPQGCTSKECCCRCKGCQCKPTQSNSYQPAPATITSPTRKPSLQGHHYQSAPYYYGSLGRRSREPRPMLHTSTTNNNIYGQQGNSQYGNMNTLRSNIGRSSNPPIDIPTPSSQYLPSLDSPGYNYITLNKSKQIR